MIRAILLCALMAIYVQSNPIETVKPLVLESHIQPLKLASELENSQLPRADRELLVQSLNQTAELLQEAANDPIRPENLLSDAVLNASVAILSSDLERNLTLVKRDVDDKMGKVVDEPISPELVKMCSSSSSGFKYFQAYPNDARKYVVCDPWGSPVIKSCDEGLIWDQWKLRCSVASEIESNKFDWSFLEQNQTGVEVFDCNQPKWACLNDGVCRQLNGANRCVCSDKWTGDLCEIELEAGRIFSDIMSGSWSLAKFKVGLEEEKSRSDDLAFFEQYKNVLGKETWEELVKYLNMYPAGSIRFDRLVNRLIEEVLQDIYPDAFYLSVYNVSSQTVSQVVRMIPNLLAYSKYSAERYDQVFVQYQRVLEKLVAELKAEWPLVWQEAGEYRRLTDLFFNLTLNNTEMFPESKSLISGVQREAPLSEVEVRENMRRELNETLVRSNELFSCLLKFQQKAIEEIKENPSLMRTQMAAVKIVGSEETIKNFDEIAQSSASLWDQLVNFGFWYLTNALAQPEVRV